MRPRGDCGVFAVIYSACATATAAGRIAPEAPQSLGIELTWTLIPFALFIAVFVWSLRFLRSAHAARRVRRRVYVVAKQWMWKVQHPGGQREINDAARAARQAGAPDHDLART